MVTRARVNTSSRPGITSKMKTARSDHYGSNLKVWFPCDDTSGDTLTDRINSLVVNDFGSSVYAEPHAVTFDVTAETGTGIAAVQLPSQGVFFMIQKVVTSFALTSATLGKVDVGSTGVQLSGTGSTLKNSGGTVGGSVGGTAAAGDIIAMAAAWDETNLYTYYGEDADLALGDTDALTAGLIAALPENLTDSIGFNTSSLPSHVYGLALFDFSTNGLPSDLLAGLNWMKDAWTSGHKEIYSPWKSLT